MARNTLQNLTATLFFVFTFFSLGEAAFEAHVNYPAWLVAEGVERVDVTATAPEMRPDTRPGCGRGHKM